MFCNYSQSIVDSVTLTLHIVYQGLVKLISKFVTLFINTTFMQCVLYKRNKPVGDMARAYTGDADAVLDHGLLIAM